MTVPPLPAALRGLALASLLGVSLAATAARSGDIATSAGERIYREGVLLSGAPLQAMRAAGLAVSGSMAACANCHRRSGLGMREGRQNIPPIAGSYLFHPRAGTADDLDLPFVEGMQADRDPYTDATLARAIRTGVDVEGNALSDLMPRYALDDADMAALVAYLRRLLPASVPGVTDEVLHFATIVTPDADPVKRQGVLDVLEKFFEDKNHYTRAVTPRVRSSFRLRYKVNRHWVLHVWELHGPADTWESQLQADLAAEPVFAVISGIGGRNWAPVHEFCKRAALPCLFPNVDVPVLEADGFDNVYLSQGVLLEAGLIANAIRGAPARGRVLQIFRNGDAGENAAAALAAALAQQDMRVVPLALPAQPRSRDLAAALRKAERADVLVLWLRARDIGELSRPPPAIGAVYMSGRMAGLEEAPLPAAWRPMTHMAYPVDLPERRRVRLDFALGWFRIRQVPVVALPEQADTYLACGIVSDTINHMTDTFVRDYLVERIEGMVEHRVITGYYPRLTLAQGQRFASKGGYLVQFAEPSGRRIVPDGEWSVP